MNIYFFPFDFVATFFIRHSALILCRLSLSIRFVFSLYNHFFIPLLLPSLVRFIPRFSAGMFFMQPRRSLSVFPYLFTTSETPAGSLVASNSTSLFAQELF